MTSRTRAFGFATLAVLCAVASGSIASAYRESVDERLGETRQVLTVSKPLRAGVVLRGHLLDSSTALREVPVKFLPPDAISDPVQVIGRKPLAPIPAGSYLLASQLRTSTPDSPPEPALGNDLHPFEVTVNGAGALAVGGSIGGRRVDVVVAAEPVTGGRARVTVAARAVRLIAIAPASPEQATTAGGDSWTATLALTRKQALELIEAENFAREIRLIPAS